MGAKAELAEEYFNKGYNCAQSVLLAFSDDIPISFEAAAKAASSFGGGVGKMREICGAISGMAMAAGLIYGPDTLDREQKEAHGRRIRDLSEKFRREYGSIVCRELLAFQEEREGKAGALSCRDLVKTAAEILERSIITEKTAE